MSSMFNGCESLSSLDVSSFVTGHVTDMCKLFSYCKSLKTIYVGTGWNTNKLEESEDMFRNCTSLVGGKGTKYDSEFVDVERLPTQTDSFLCEKDVPAVFHLDGDVANSEQRREHD